MSRYLLNATDLLKVPLRTFHSIALHCAIYVPLRILGVPKYRPYCDKNKMPGPPRTVDSAEKRKKRALSARNRRANTVNIGSAKQKWNEPCLFTSSE